MKSKKLVIALLLVLAFVFTTGTFAYWASTVTTGTASSTGTVTIGSGDTVTSTVNVTAQLNETNSLVPVGFANDPNEVSTLDFTFPVTWTTDTPASADALSGTLAVTIDSVEINGTDKSSLFTVSVTSGDGAITEDSAQDVVINVEFTNEPADSTEYTAVANQDLIVTVSFTVTPA